MAHQRWEIYRLWNSRPSQSNLPAWPLPLLFSSHQPPRACSKCRCSLIALRHLQVCRLAVEAMRPATRKGNDGLQCIKRLINTQLTSPPLPPSSLSDLQPPTSPIYFLAPLSFSEPDTCPLDFPVYCCSLSPPLTCLPNARRVAPAPSSLTFGFGIFLIFHVLPALDDELDLTSTRSDRLLRSEASLTVDRSFARPVPSSNAVAAL